MSKKKKDNFQKNLALNMQDEISDLDQKINESNDNIKRNKRMKKLKISLACLQAIYPYIVSTGILLGGFKFLEAGYPFVKDNNKNYLVEMKDFDSYNNTRYEQYYDSFLNDLPTSFLKHYGQWEKNDDNTYTREVKSYEIKLDDISEKSEKKLKEIVKNNDENFNLENLFGKPKYEIKETKNNLTEEELNKKDYLQAILYDLNKDDFILVKESTAFNVGATIGFIIFLLFLYSEIKSFRKAFNSDFYKRLSLIEERYDISHLEDYVKTLEKQKNNYNKSSK